MKKCFLAAFCLNLLLGFSSCEKCYRCHNLCKICTYTYTSPSDTTLTLTVCSDKLSMKYYNEYIDSLSSPSLGWTCTDAASNAQNNFCGSKTENIINLINRKNAGWICAGE